MNGQLGEQVAEDDVETGIGPVLTLLDLRVRCVKGDIIECVRLYRQRKGNGIAMDCKRKIEGIGRVKII